MLLRYLFLQRAIIPYDQLKKEEYRESKTIGEQIVNRRIELGQLQDDIAKIIAVASIPLIIARMVWESRRYILI